MFDPTYYRKQSRACVRTVFTEVPSKGLPSKRQNARKLEEVEKLRTGNRYIDDEDFFKDRLHIIEVPRPI